MSRGSCWRLDVGRIQLLTSDFYPLRVFSDHCLLSKHTKKGRKAPPFGVTMPLFFVSDLNVSNNHIGSLRGRLVPTAKVIILPRAMFVNTLMTDSFTVLAAGELLHQKNSIVR